MRHANQSNQAGRPGRAFTMIELMVVMMIIALLATILVPSVTAARTAAQVASTRTLIFTLESALNMFRADEVVGREYPPSYWNAAQQGDPYGTDAYEAFGAQTLLWAVCGADLLGTPGFQRRVAIHTLRFMYLNQNVYQRRGPFLDPGELNIVRLDEGQCAIPWEGRFEQQIDRGSVAPVILDNFDMPVLYYRNTGTGAFDSFHNLPFTRAAYSPTGYSLDRDGTWWLNGTGNDRRGLFAYAEDRRIWELSSGATSGAHNRDSFILVSTGPDQLYGTGDDITNFPLNDPP